MNFLNEDCEIADYLKIGDILNSLFVFRLLMGDVTMLLLS